MVLLPLLILLNWRLCRVMFRFIIMKCAKVQLQERSRPRVKLEVNLDRPRRYCQKRLVNPEHEEDPRWNDMFDRFHCNISNGPCDLNETYDSVRVQQEVEDLFLSVQNLQFKGDVPQRKRPRTSFKYKNLSGGKKHRMFVKQIVDCEYEDPGRTSELKCYYIDDYAKYFLSYDRSRPSSGKSSVFIYNLTNKSKENKAIQVDITKAGETRKTRQPDAKAKKSPKKDVTLECKDKIKNEQDENNIEDTKIAFYKRGKRKSLTISRTESPATVQVIRVDVVCNYSCSSTASDYDDNKQTSVNEEKEGDRKKETLKVKNTQFVNKYLLTNTVKTLDENVSGGAKVTLLCKTFRLADRSKSGSRRKPKSAKDVPNTNKKVKV